METFAQFFSKHNNQNPNQNLQARQLFDKYVAEYQIVISFEDFKKILHNRQGGLNKKAEHAL